MKETHTFYLGALFKETLFTLDMNKTHYPKKKMYFCAIC